VEVASSHSAAAAAAAVAVAVVDDDGGVAAVGVAAVSEILARGKCVMMQPVVLQRPLLYLR